MEFENKITGPGYYPKRPTRSGGGGGVHRFDGVPYQVRVLQQDRYTDIPNVVSWDQCSWAGPGQYSVECIVSPSKITQLEVRNSDGDTIYIHNLPSLLKLEVGQRYTFTLDNPTPSWDLSASRQWIRP